MNPRTERNPGVWDRQHRSLTVGLLLTISITAFEAMAVATVLPAAVNDLGGLAWYGWVFSGFMLGNLVSIAVAGRWTDMRGPVPPFVAGAALFATGLFIAGSAPSMTVVVSGRLAQGLGAGALSSVAYVAIARGYPANLQPRMLAMVASAWVVPGLMGPALAGSVADHLGWRWVFLGLAPLTVLAASLALTGLRRLTAPAGVVAEPSQVRSAILLAAGTGIALFGADSNAAGITAACAAAGIAIGLPALRRLLPDGTLRAEFGTPAAIAAMILLNYAFFGAEAFLPLSLTSVRNESTTVAGLALTAGTLAWTSGAWLQERLVTRYSRRLIVCTGLALTAIGIVGAASVLSSSTPVWIAALSWATAGLGIGLAYSTITLIVLELAPDGREGAATAALQLANVLGVALGTGLGGATLTLATAAGGSQAFGIALIDAAMIAAASLGLAAARRLPSRRPNALPLPASTLVQHSAAAA